MSPRAPKQPIFFHPGRTPGTVVVYAQAWTVAPIENAPEATDNLPTDSANDLSKLHGVCISLHTEEFHIDEVSPLDFAIAGLLPGILDSTDDMFGQIKNLDKAIKKHSSSYTRNLFAVKLASIGELFGGLPRLERTEPILPSDPILRIEQLPYARCSLTVGTSSKAVTGLVHAYRSNIKALVLPQCGIKDISTHPALTTSYKNLGVCRKNPYIALDLA